MLSGVSGPQTLLLRGRILELKRPLVMGILNLTPDSFYEPSRQKGVSEAVGRVERMLEEGADIIDIGACSTRPGSISVSAEEELARLEHPMEAIRKAFPDALISLDTFRASVAASAIERWGIDIINDISGLADPEMTETVAAGKVVYVLTHMRGTPHDMMEHCDYGVDVTAEVVRDLAFKLDSLRAAGVCDVIIDPGFGFAKTTRQNLDLLARLERFSLLGCPILAGISRKRMTREAAGCSVDDALVPTVAMNAVALMKGASIIRVHDVREGVLTARTIERLRN